METTLSTNKNTAASSSKSASITGWVISGLMIAFLLFDAICKIIKEQHAISASASLGITESLLPGIGIILLICIIVYAIPRVAIIGAILLTGYLGGAIAIMMRAGQPVYFALVFGLLVWAGLYLRNIKVRALFLS